MIEKSIHLTNANTLTHQWEPTCTENTLSVDGKGVITIVPNSKRHPNWPIELQMQAKLIQEFRIFTTHCQTMIQIANEIKNEIGQLPSTDITQYHQKISRYQGVINLLSKHTTFLQKTTKILKEKYHEKSNDITPNQELLGRFKHIEKINDDCLVNLKGMIKGVREHQKLSAGEFEQTTGILRNNDITIPARLFFFEARSFGIGNYTYQDKHYQVDIGFNIEPPFDWSQNLTQNLLGNLLFKTIDSDSHQGIATMEVTVTWIQNEYLILPPRSLERTNHVEPTAWGVHYPSLFASEQFILPNVEPTLFIKNQNYHNDDLYHIRKLYQALVEWMQFYNFNEIVIYDYENNAPIHYSFGFTTSDNALSNRMANLLSEHLERGEKPTPDLSQDNDQHRLPFTLKKSQLTTSKVYQFESNRAVPYSELINKAPVLNYKTIPNTHPMISGVDFLSHSKRPEMIFSREVGRSPKSPPVKIRAVPVDYCDLMSPSELMACAQVSDADQKLARIPSDEKTVLKIKR